MILKSYYNSPIPNWMKCTAIIDPPFAHRGARVDESCGKQRFKKYRNYSWCNMRTSVIHTSTLTGTGHSSHRADVLTAIWKFTFIIFIVIMYLWTSWGNFGNVKSLSTFLYLVIIDALFNLIFIDLFYHCFSLVFQLCFNWVTLTLTFISQLIKVL